MPAYKFDIKTHSMYLLCIGNSAGTYRYFTTHLGTIGRHLRSFVQCNFKSLIRRLVIMTELKKWKVYCLLFSAFVYYHYLLISLR